MLSLPVIYQSTNAKEQHKFTFYLNLRNKLLLFDFSFSHEYLFYIILFLFHKRALLCYCLSSYFKKIRKTNYFSFPFLDKPTRLSTLYTFHTHFYPSTCLLYFPFFPFIHNIIGISFPHKSTAVQWKCNSGSGGLKTD